MAYELIKRKRAIRNFSEKPVSQEIINQILNSGRLAQSSKNEQKWKFILIKDPERLEKLSKTGNFTSHIGTAAFAVVLVNTGGWDFDLGQAAANMQLVALENNIGSCLAYFQREDDAKLLLEVPEEHSITIGISFGYPRDKITSKGSIAGRKRYDEVVTHEIWSE